MVWFVPYSSDDAAGVDVVCDQCGTVQRVPADDAGRVDTVPVIAAERRHLIGADR